MTLLFTFFRKSTNKYKQAFRCVADDYEVSTTYAGEMRWQCSDHVYTCIDTDLILI
jgi:hypothetical protein